MSAAMSYGSDLTGDIRRGPLCRADGMRVASVEPGDGLQYWDHACPGAHALDAVELTVVGARSTIKQSPPSAATNSDRLRSKNNFSRRADGTTLDERVVSRCTAAIILLL